MGTLLGFLARFGSLFVQGEVLCTQGLAYLLREYSEARLAFADELAARTGVTLGTNLTWQAESYQTSDGARPDLEALLDETPVVKVEAKLGAAMSTSQFESYVTDLQQRLLGQRDDGLLVVLVPQGRTTEATSVLKKAFDLDGLGPWRFSKEGFPAIKAVVLSWDEVLTALGRVESERFRGELEQFEGMYRELANSYIMPLAEQEILDEWRKREDDLSKLVDQVTRLLTTEHRHYPFYDFEDYKRRYVCRSLRGAKPCFSVGLHDPFQGFTTPVWLRFDRETPCYHEILKRLESSDLRQRLVMSGGHVWIPLEVPFNTASGEMVNALLAQVEAVSQIAYQ